jgi:hypothetical protein
MSSNRGSTIRCALATLLGSLWVNAAYAAAIGCPPTHDGRPLADVGLFDGPPSERVELEPERGRWVIDKRDEPSSPTLPYFTLGCTYRGSHEVVTVVLPRSVRVCEITKGPNARCR